MSQMMAPVMACLPLSMPLASPLPADIIKPNPPKINKTSVSIPAITNAFRSTIFTNVPMFLISGAGDKV